MPLKTSGSKSNVLIKLHSSNFETISAVVCSAQFCSPNDEFESIATFVNVSLEETYSGSCKFVLL